jgi:hypothetical protein
VRATLSTVELDAVAQRLEAWPVPLAAIVAAYDCASPGRPPKCEVAVVERRPGPTHALYRAVTLARVPTPDEGSRHTLESTLRRLADALSAELVVHPPGPGCAVAAVRWIDARGPAAPMPWRVLQRTRWYDDAGRRHEREDDIVAEASSPGIAAAFAERERPALPDGAIEVRSFTTVMGLDEPPRETVRKVPPSREAARAVRERLEEGAAPSRIATDLDGSPRHALSTFAEALRTEPEHAEPVAAFRRGEIDGAELDAALAPFLARPSWRVALGVARAFERDVISPELAASARSMGPLPLMILLIDEHGLRLSEAKALVGELSSLGERLHDPGSLSSALRRVRAALSR